MRFLPRMLLMLATAWMTQSIWMPVVGPIWSAVSDQDMSHIGRMFDPDKLRDAVTLVKPSRATNGDTSSVSNRASDGIREITEKGERIVSRAGRAVSSSRDSRLAPPPGKGPPGMKWYAQHSQPDCNARAGSASWYLAAGEC